jgi:hypothetical protein
MSLKEEGIGRFWRRKLQSSPIADCKVFQRECIQQERERIRQAHGELGLTVLDIFARHDPLSIVCEANPAEYEPVLHTMLPRLLTARCSNDVQRIAHEAVTLWLGVGAVNAGPESAYVALGHELWKAMKRPVFP